MAASISETRSWHLPERIIALSHATTWPEAAQEWKLKKIKLLAAGEAKHCLCGHTIRELCHIRNVKNANEAIVGNICIKKFTSEGGDTKNAFFASIPTIIGACKRLLKNPQAASANDALIKYASDQGLFSANATAFYMRIRKDRILVPHQAAYKKSFNQKLLYELILSPQAAFKRLESDRTNTAGPKLINFAFEKGVLQLIEKNFYLDHWNNQSLNAAQEAWRLRINDIMIKELPAYFNQAPGRPGGHGAGAGAAHPAEPVAASHSPPLKRRRVQREALPPSTEGSQASASAAASAASSDEVAITVAKSR